jgi:TolA-binding protein
MLPALRKSLALLLLPALFACAKEEGKVLAGDTTKTTEQVKTEAATLDKAGLQKMVDQCTADLKTKEAKLTELQGKVDTMSKDPAKLVSAEMTTLKSEYDTLKAEVEKIKANLAIYQQELAKK